MSFVCEYCTKELTSQVSLQRHQKTTKYCLKIQQRNNKEIKIEQLNFVCEFCNKSFSSKQKLNSHIEKSCTHKLNSIIDKYETKLLEKDDLINQQKEEIGDLEKKIIELEAKLEIYKEQGIKSFNVVEKIAQQPRVQQNNNQKILITSPMDLSQEKIKDMIDHNFNANYMIQGQKGVAKFAYDTMLKDEEGKLKYICTDPSRQIFQYKNEEGEIQKDVKAKKLTKALLDGELKSVSHKIASDKMADNADDFLEYSTYYLDIKELEDDNSDFSKELSTLVI